MAEAAGATVESCLRLRLTLAEAGESVEAEAVWLLTAGAEEEFECSALEADAAEDADDDCVDCFLLDLQGTCKCAAA